MHGKWIGATCCCVCWHGTKRGDVFAVRVLLLYMTCVELARLLSRRGVWCSTRSDNNLAAVIFLEFLALRSAGARRVGQDKAGEAVPLREDACRPKPTGGRGNYNSLVYAIVPKNGQERASLRAAKIERA